MIPGDVRSAWRSLRRYPIACAIAILSLAAGIGSTTATITVRNAVFLDPPPLYRDPAELSKVELTRPDGRRGMVPGPVFRAWLDDPGLAAALAAMRPGQARPVRAERGTRTLPVSAATPNLFALLGVAPALGHAGPDAVSHADAAPAVLSHRAWQLLFEARRDVIGQIIRSDGTPHTVIGVMPERFWFASMGPAVWTRLDERALQDQTPLHVVARRAATLSEAALVARLQRGIPDRDRPNLSDLVRGRPNSSDLVRGSSLDATGQSRGEAPCVRLSTIGGTPLGAQVASYVVWLLGASVFFTLLISCANVALLLIVQWTAREHELAVRQSLGASRASLVRLLLTESLVIAALGGLLGVGLAAALTRWIESRVPAASFVDLSIDWPILLQSALVTLFAGIGAGMAPALYETRRRHAHPLAVRPSDRVRQRWRHALVVFEVAVTMALLVVTGAMISAYRRTLSATTGFDTSRVLAASVENQAGVPIEALVERLGALPGVTHAAASSAVPLVATGSQERVAIDLAGTRAVVAERVDAEPGFFAALGVRVIAGQVFTDGDAATGRPVMVVNALVAERLWGDRDPVGAEVWIGGVSRRVVGVVAAYKDGPLRPARPIVYAPIVTGSEAATRVHVIVRTDGDPSALIAPVRQAIIDLPTDDVIASLTALDRVLDSASEEILGTTYPLLPLIVTGIVLTAAGIYGVLAFSVERRSRELAVRIALGASTSSVLRLVALESTWLMAAGVLFGGGVTVVLTRLAQGQGGIFDAPGWPAFAIPLLIVGLVAFAATWTPWPRACRIEPAILLK